MTDTNDPGDVWDDSALAGLHADLEAVADLDDDQLHYLEHADEVEDETTDVECDSDEVYPGDEQYRDMSSEELLNLLPGEDGSA